MDKRATNKKDYRVVVGKNLESQAEMVQELLMQTLVMGIHVIDWDYLLHQRLRWQ